MEFLTGFTLGRSIQFCSCPGKPQVMLIIFPAFSRLAMTNGQPKHWPIETGFRFLGIGHTKPNDLFFFFLRVLASPRPRVILFLAGILISVFTFRFSIFGAQEQTFLFMADRHRNPRPVLPQRTRQVISEIFFSVSPCLHISVSSRLRVSASGCCKRSFYFHTVNSNVHQSMNTITIKMPMIPPLALSKRKSS